ncbi:hypothetical protein [Pseudonocardia dioxanivorans]|jgi:hypothetical protein|uniref:hypothetical protein n=1 Tax=Pseudonocardia dioxanivorans TaxID=240495 RepID=UPI000CD1CDF2|nr:hypothetical protein [Pseudonocardia dioxanivorans]
MADGLADYGRALDLAVSDIVAAFLDHPDDRPRAERAAREVTVWLAGLYGRDAVRDLAERLAAEICDSLRERGLSGEPEAPGPARGPEWPTAHDVRRARPATDRLPPGSPSRGPGRPAVGRRGTR